MAYNFFVWSFKLSLIILQLIQKSMMTTKQVPSRSKLFLTYFRSLIDHQCTIDVQLKMDFIISGKLKFIDNNMCMLLDCDQNQIKKLPPQFAALSKGVYIRGSAIRAVYMPKNEQDIEILQDLCKKNQ